jgi:hypothetical protein
MPIYLGCKNIDSYIDDTIKLSGDIKTDILLLKNILQNPNANYKKTYTEKNIKAVNLLENIEKLFAP